MLEQVLTHIHNWFQIGIFSSKITIKNGTLDLPFLKDGQYFRIMGSVFNDGLHRYGPDMELLEDETFDGSIWVLAIPKAVVELAGEIAEWQEKYGAVTASPYTSESFAGYSYSKSGGAEAGSTGGWQGAFRGRLNPYRKIREV